MNPLRILLVLQTLAIALYTAVVVARDGIGLLSVFFGDIAKLGWPGQFNLDFFCLLQLSALWVASRHRFRPVGLLLGLGALFGGSFFLCPYLLWASLAARGDLAALLTGESARSP